MGSAFGIMTEPPAVPEMMELWVMPIALAGALGCYALATLVLCRTGRRLLRKAALQFLPCKGRGTMRSMVEGCNRRWDFYFKPQQPLRQDCGLPPPLAREE